jgi:outer membrane protein OmpA-like peptidoglycan-associated protein
MARVRTTTIILTLALLAPAALAQQQYQDPTAIIRSLAPKKYLPEHSGVRAAEPAQRAIDLEVPFQLGSAELTDVARRQLDALAEAMRAPELADSRFLIAGHTDATGAADYNKALSERRARSVLRYLVEIHGVTETRLLAAGFGEERLKNAGQPEAAENRRVEVVALDAEAPAQPQAETAPKKPRTEKITY